MTYKVLLRIRAALGVSATLVSSACEAPRTVGEPAERLAPVPTLATPSASRAVRRVFTEADIPPEVPFKRLSDAECERLVAEARAYLDQDGRRCEQDSDCVLYDVHCPIGRCFEAINRDAVARSDAALKTHRAGCPSCCTKCQRPTNDAVACRDGSCVWLRK
jgi:hypothetical protein